MKRALLALTLLVCATAEAQRIDSLATLKNYASKVLPRCPGGTLTFEPTPVAPMNFIGYTVTLRSTDQYCGAQKYLLHSPKSGQILIGTVIDLPRDARAANLRVAERAGQMLKTQTTANIAPFPLPDGIRTVAITRQTQYGPFAYQGFIDASEGYLIVGFRGNLHTDPAKTLRDALGASAAAQRGKSGAKVEILELSDFQCPTCARAHEKVEPIIQKNLSRLSYSRLDLPLFEHHEWAIPAAMAARAIQRTAPAKYWGYVDYVFKNQEQIGKRPFDETLKEFCEDQDIDFAALQKIYASKAERQALLDQVSRAFAIGVNSTPTFIVNGQIMGFGPEGSFTIEAIKSAIASGTPAAAKKTGK
jgi:protein-disulfide isomerase